MALGMSRTRLSMIIKFCKQNPKLCPYGGLPRGKELGEKDRKNIALYNSHFVVLVQVLCSYQHF